MTIIFVGKFANGEQFHRVVKTEIIPRLNESIYFFDSTESRITGYVYKIQHTYTFNEFDDVILTLKHLKRL